MSNVLTKVFEALTLSAGMFWDVGWSLVLGFAISGAIQTLVSNSRMRALLGRDGPKEIAIATIFGAASSSCSYASAAVTRSIFAKGAALVPSLAFLFSSTNLVIELGIVLWLLMAWQFTLAEWIGGIVLVGIMSVLVKLTYPRKLVEEARERAKAAEAGMDHDMTVEGTGWLAKIRNPQFPIVMAQHFAMDWSMLWVDLVLGFLIAGALASFVPSGVWHVLFLGNAPEWVQTIGGAFIGPLIAIVTFVCSIGNVPMAAILWSGGIGFSGVLAFLYADLIVLPLLDVYRKYYGLRMAAYIGGIFYVTMAASAIVMEVAFKALHLVPKATPNAAAMLVHFKIDYTFWLNVVFGALAAYFVYLNWRNPMHGSHEMAASNVPTASDV
ncbi:MAG: permease [Vulcanimicrobiaceae bacterium]